MIWRSKSPPVDLPDNYSLLILVDGGQCHPPRLTSFFSQVLLPFQKGWLANAKLKKMLKATTNYSNTGWTQCTGCFFHWSSPKRRTSPKSC